MLTHTESSHLHRHSKTETVIRKGYPSTPSQTHTDWRPQVCECAATRASHLYSCLPGNGTTSTVVSPGTRPPLQLSPRERDHLYSCLPGNETTSTVVSPETRPPLQLSPRKRDHLYSCLTRKRDHLYSCLPGNETTSTVVSPETGPPLQLSRDNCRGLPGEKRDRDLPKLITD